MKIGIDPKYQVDSIFDTSMFKLDKDEVARICCIDTEIDVQLAHYVKTISKAGKEEGWYHACHGDYALIIEQAKGADPEKCPYCKVVVRRGTVDMAIRRFGMNIIRYVTDPKGNVRTPTQVDILGWKFSGDKYDRLVGIKSQYGNLQAMDLKVVCEGKQFQKFQIDPFPVNQCLWLTQGDEVKKFIEAKFKEERTPSLIELLCNFESVDQAQKIANEAMGLGPANGNGNGHSAPPMAPQSKEQLQNLLDNGPAAPPAQPAANLAQPLAPPPNTAAAPATAPAAPATGAASFADLLNS